MPIRITGLNSGLDTESIISALVSSYNYKTQKYQKAQTKLSWKQDAWKTLNTKIYSLYKNVGNMKLSSAYNMKSAAVSDATKVSVTAGSNSVNGSYSVHVTSMAKAGYLTGGQLKSGTTASTTLSELGYNESGTMSLTVGGKTTDIAVDGNTTIQSVVNSLKDAGVRASFDEKNGRIYISAKDTGEGNDFSLTGANANGTEALKALGLNVMSAAEKAQYAKLAKYYMAGTDAAAALENTKNHIQDILTGKQNAADANAKLEQSNSWYDNAISYANAVNGIAAVEGKVDSTAITTEDFDLLRTLVSKDSLENTYVDSDGNLYTYDSEKDVFSTVKEDGTVVEVSAEDIKGDSYTAASVKYDELVKEFGLVTDDDKTALTEFKNNLKTVADIAAKAETEAAAGDSTFADLLENAEQIADGNMVSVDGNEISSIADLIDSYSGVVSANNKEIKANNDILAANAEITVGMTEEQVAAFAEKVVYANSMALTSTADANSDGLGATRVEGSDAVIYVNGAKYTGTSNTFSVNGLTITATGVTCTESTRTDDNAVNVTVSTDVQGLYDKVKDFLSQYNSLINEMTSLYNAASAKGYEPLTDEERDAMSDTEVEKWEEKIKSSLLRRDDTLSGIISSMTNAMSKGVEVDGKTYYLSNFGIKTLGYLNAPTNEHNAYHIDGDEDDVNTSGNADKLMAALSQDPETVVEFMQKLSQNLYNAVDTKMKSTSLSSIYTVYNDKEMASEYSDYTSLITKWQERLEKQEEYYYNKFAAMESALAKINSQSSSLSGLFGS